MILGETPLGKKRIKILWVTDDPWQKTGYGMVTRHVLKRLQRDYYDEFEVVALATQHRGGQIYYHEDCPDTEDLETLKRWRKETYKIYPAYNHPDGYDILEEYMRRLNPDIVVTLRDVGLQAGYIPAITNMRKMGWKGKWYGYLPIDSKTVIDEWIPYVTQMDKVIAMSEWGRVMWEQQTKDFIKPFLIPHGVDINVFKPMKEEVRKKIAKAGAPFSEMFVIGAIGRNQYRKMWVYLIKGFAEFAKDKNDVALLLHSDLTPLHPSDGWSFPHITHKYGCTKKVHYTFNKLDLYWRTWVSDEKLNEIYNSMDVFCLSTGGEGFGIPLLEAQSCGVPVVTTAFTTGFELVKGHGELIDVLKDKHGDDVCWVGQNGVEFAIPDWRDITKKLQKLYEDRKLLEKYGKESREHALKYDWNKIVELWVKLFREKPSDLEKYEKQR